MTIIKHFDAWDEQSLEISIILKAVLSRFDIEKGREVAVVLTNDAEIRQMNADFRGKDKPTNVLSFPSDESDELGDIILAHETIAREAEEQSKGFAAHFTHLLVHGTLHLLGYDHEAEEEAEEMEALEIEILAQLGLANPYE